MATYVNNLRLKEIATGDSSGTWGDETNTNLELIGQAFGYGTRAIADASTDNITIADGASDSDRSMYLKLTGGGQACTVTLLPNTVSKVWIMENTTSYTLTFTCGSGANVAILAGETKCIATDGGGSGGIVYDVYTDLNLAGTTKVDDLTVSGDIDVDGVTNLDVVDIDGAVDMASTLTVGGAATFDSTVNGMTIKASASGDRWGCIPEIASNGVMEVGRYIDFHSTDGDTSDYGARFDFDGTNLIIAANPIITETFTTNLGAVFNESGADVDFRVESSNDSSALFVDGADGTTTVRKLALGVGGGLNGLGPLTISTTATNITGVNAYGSLVIVAGNEGGAIFSDLVFYATTMGATVVTGGTVSGAPAARTYSVVSSILKLAMASGSYSVSATTMQGTL